MSKKLEFTYVGVDQQECVCVYAEDLDVICWQVAWREIGQLTVNPLEPWCQG